MLRETIENVTSIKVYGILSSTGPNNTYTSGFGKFCSACHTRLNRCGGNPWTRHPVDFKLTNKEYRNWSGSTLSPRVPLEEGDMVTCITCHKSHGSNNVSLQRLSGNRMCQQCHKR
jgi:predicted CXXCH cytochrome family protein